MTRALAITGPTASGKTALSLHLAELTSGEIISCDSMQIYRGMDIGTAKATAAERARVPHHMIDFLSPRENYSVELYRTAAIECAEEIASRGKVPIFVGGTGLYIDSVMRAASDTSPESDPEYRAALLRSVGENTDALWERLREVDPESAEKTHKNNVKRVIRALEIYDKCGIPKSTLDKETRVSDSPVDIGMLTIDFHDRENLYRRVDLRVDEMMREGLLSEVESLFHEGLLSGEGTAAAAIGYKELVLYLEGRATLDEAIDLIKLATRRYAKRQLTWFRHEAGAYRLFADTECGQMRSYDELIREARAFALEFLAR